MNVSIASLVLYVLAGTCALWGLWGLLKPQAAFSFALPENRTRRRAFFFPLLRLAVPLLLIARMNSDILSDINYSVGAIIGLAVAVIWYATYRAAILAGY